MVVFVVVGAWKILQTGYMAEKISNRITKQIFKKLKTEVSFKRIGIDLFPPAITFKDIAIRRKDEHSIIDIRATELTTFFGLINIYSDKVAIQKVKISDGRIRIDTDSSKGMHGKILRTGGVENYRDIEIDKIFNIYRNDVLAKLPVRVEDVEFRDIEFLLNNESLWVNGLNLSLTRNELGIIADLEDVRIKKLANNKLFYPIDSFQINVKVNPRRLKIKEFKVRNFRDYYYFRGNIIQKEQRLIVDGAAKFSGRINDFFQLIGLDNVLRGGEIAGALIMDLRLKNDLFNPEINFEVAINKLESRWAVLDKMKVTGSKEGMIISIKEFNGTKDEGKITLRKPVQFFHLDRKKLIENKFDFHVEKLHTNAALYVIKETLHSFKGLMTGGLTFTYEPELKNLVFKTDDDFLLEEFKLQGEKEPILINPILKLRSSIFTVELGNNANVKFDINLEFENSNASAKGHVGNGKIYFDIKKARVDLEKFGPISGISLYGIGDMDIEISGDSYGTVFEFNVDINDFSIIGYNFGKIQSKISLDLERLILNIKKLYGNYKGNTYRGNGELKLGKNAKIDIDMHVMSANFISTVEMYAPVFKEIRDEIPQKLNFNYSSKYKIHGGLTGETIKVDGKLFGKNLRVYEEDVEKFEINFTFGDNVIYVKDFIFRKHAGMFKGRFLYDIKNAYWEYDGKVFGIKLSDISYYELLNLGYRGVLKGELSGSGSSGDFISRTYFNLDEAYIHNVKVEGSQISAYSNGPDYFINGNIIGDTIKLEAFLNLKKDDIKKPSYINIDVKSNNIKQMAGILSSHNMKNDTIKGVIDAKFNSSFYINDWTRLNLLLELNKFMMEKNGKRISINNKNKIIIRDGDIEYWDFAMTGEGARLDSFAKGSLREKLKMEAGFKFDANLIELISEKINRATGNIIGRVVVVGNKEKFSTYIESSGEEIVVKMSGITGIFNRLKYSITMQDNELILQRLSCDYGKGEIVAGGSINFKIPFPQIKMKATIDNSYIALFKKSSMVTSGEISLEGTRWPYLLRGNLMVVYGHLLDDMDEIVKSGGKSTGYDRFIPTEKYDRKINFFGYDIGVEIGSPIVVRNSLVDLKLGGRARISGTRHMPVYDGEFKIIPGSSKLFFKGNEFAISQGKITFDEKTYDNMAEINFTGDSRIGKHDVKMNIHGKVDNPNVNLTSSPPLPQEDILSLLALGFTPEISKNLEDKDRQALTSVGVGSLLAEQFKLNQGLNSSLGLKLSVLPEFGDSESVGGGKGTEASTTRVKSATRVKIKKKIGKKMDLSVSSTVGGSLGQRQEMNINYNIDKKWSLQGVYEIKSSDSDTAAESLESFGADLKLRVPF